jgi:NTP pyrophosphatase (non-canonical NTP hydrolase)
MPQLALQLRYAEGMDESLIVRLREFVHLRDWEPFHTPKNLSMALASEAGELLACFRWLTPSESEVVLNDEVRAGPVLDELGDVGICLLMLCDRLGASLPELISRKIDANELRYPADKARGRSTKYTDL